MKTKTQKDAKTAEDLELTLETLKDLTTSDDEANDVKGGAGATSKTGQTR